RQRLEAAPKERLAGELDAPAVTVPELAAEAVDAEALPGAVAADELDAPRRGAAPDGIDNAGIDLVQRRRPAEQRPDAPRRQRLELRRLGHAAVRGDRVEARLRSEPR